MSTAILERLGQRTPPRSDLVKLLHDVTVLVDRARSLNQALQGILDRLCSELGSPMGHAFVPGPTDALEFGAGIRRFATPGGEQLILASQGARYRPGEGWIGQAMALAGPLSIRDLRVAQGVSGDPRHRLALDLGLRGLFVYPVTLRGEVIAVLEFFTVEPFRSTEGLLEAMAQISIHLGWLVERQRTEEELRLARQRTETATRTGEDFFAIVSHRVRTPMNAVLGLTELLLHTSLTAEQKECLEMVHASGKGVMTTFDDVLSFLKLEWGAVELARQPFHLREVIEDALATIAKKVPTKDLNLSYRISDSVPDTLVGDATRLRQVLLHLLDNAVEFTPKGEVVVTVRATGKVESGAPPTQQLELTVRDTGIGMTSDRLDRLFQPFSQIDLGRTGLGLAICQRLCRLLGDELKVETELGRGSVFRFTIIAEVPGPNVEPVRREAGGQTADVASGSDSADPAPSWDVLVVEDDRINQAVAVRMLEALNQRPQVAASGREALAAMRARRFDIVLMDIEMPEIDGFETTRLIRHMRPADEQPTIIAMTAKAMPGDREKCLAAGMNGYISKPITLETLRKTLEDSRKVFFQHQKRASA